MIVSVWALEDATGRKATDEAEASVTHVWQAELLAAACAKRYRSFYAVCIDGEPVQVYNSRGMVRTVRKPKAEG